MSLTKFQALYQLWQVYLHMRAWCQPEYARLGESSRHHFAELVEARALFNYVEDCKRDLVRSGAEVPDAWLRVLVASHLTPDEPLPQDEADHLGAILDEMYPMLVRLEAESKAIREDQDRRIPAAVLEDSAEDAVTADLGHDYPSLEAPPFTDSEIAVIRTLARFDPMELASGAKIEAEMEASVRRAQRTIGKAVERLIKLGLAERPMGKRSGVRLTIAGRRVVREIAD